MIISLSHPLAHMFFQVHASIALIPPRLPGKWPLHMSIARVHRTAAGRQSPYPPILDRSSRWSNPMPSTLNDHDKINKTDQTKTIKISTKHKDIKDHQGPDFPVSARTAARANGVGYAWACFVLNSFFPFGPTGPRPVSDTWGHSRNWHNADFFGLRTGLQILLEKMPWALSTCDWPCSHNANWVGFIHSAPKAHIQHWTVVKSNSGVEDISCKI